jgi:hypothetical protein
MAFFTSRKLAASSMLCEPRLRLNLWGFVNWVRSDNKLQATYYLPEKMPPRGALVIFDKAYFDAAFGWHYRKPTK